MRSRPDGARWWARIDLRLALFAAGGTAALMGALVFGFSVFAMSEALEESARGLDEASRELRLELEAGTPPAALRGLHRSILFRVQDGEATGTIDAAGWPTGAAFEAASLKAVLRAGAGDALVRRVSLVGGRTLEVALPLRHFVRERGELLRLAGVFAAIGLATSTLFGVAAARRALRPVDALGARIRAIRPSSLEARVPTRGTSDALDELSRSINEVLGRLEWAFARLSDFSADVAHELRTGINRVLTESEVALLSEGTGRGALERIHETAEQMRDVVEQLLLLARGEEGRLAPAREPVDVDALCRKMVEFYAPLAESLGKTLEAKGEAGGTLADRALLERALANLVENALRHSARGATVRVEAAAARDGLRIGVLDSGPGIPPEDRERIFERFARLDPARHGRGAGLGLPIARMIARLHGGELVVQDASLGGAAFWLSLPPCEDDRRPEDRSRVA